MQRVSSLPVWGRNSVVIDCVAIDSPRVADASTAASSVPPVPGCEGLLFAFREVSVPALLRCAEGCFIPPFLAYTLLIPW